jgi:hypothetical protein
MGVSRARVLSVVKIRRAKTMAVEQLADLTSGISLDDWAFVGRVAAGDRYALESLYGRYHHRLAGFLWRCICRFQYSLAKISTIYDRWPVKVRY